MDDGENGLETRANRWTVVVVAGSVLLLDQAAKWIITQAIGPDGARDRIAVFGDWLALDYVENRGLAFGLLHDRGEIAFVLASVALTALIVGWARGGRATGWQQTAIGMIVGGAIANLVDRVRLGYVVDYVDVGPWPTFNLADASITVGVVVMVIAFSQDEFGSRNEPERPHGVGRRAATQPE